MKYNCIKYFPDKNHENLNESSIMLAFAATNTLMLAYRLYKEFLTKAAKECKQYIGRDKSLCMAKFELDGLKLKKEHLENGLKDCDKARDPKSCKMKIEKELDKTNKEIEKKEKQFKMLYDLVKKEERENKKKRGK
ncbi:MAG: hypothetical protein ACOC2W_00065 [bacterium]